MRYFEKAGWDAAWIRDARKLVNKEFKSEYAAYVPPVAAPSAKRKRKVKFINSYILRQRLTRPQAAFSDDGFSPDELSDVETSSLKNELEAYLDAPRVDTDDPLGWWSENRHLYPRLWRMARDYLTIPGAPHLSDITLSATNLFPSHHCLCRAFLQSGPASYFAHPQPPLREDHSCTALPPLLEQDGSCGVD